MQYGVGIEGIDLESATRHNIPVCKIPSDQCSNALSCAEHAIFLALGCLRNYKGLVHSISDGKLGSPCGRTLFSSSVAIIGLGGIGIELAKRLKPFGVKINAIVRNIEQEYDHEWIDSITSILNWNEIAPTIDIVFLCCPLTKETYGMVNDSFLSCLKQESIIINVARGGLINYEDILKALNTNQLSGLGIDVFHTEPFPMNSNDPILSHQKVIATPHVAGVTFQSYKEMADIIANNVRNLQNNLPLRGLCNSIQ